MRSRPELFATCSACSLSLEVYKKYAETPLQVFGYQPYTITPTFKRYLKETTNYSYLDQRSRIIPSCGGCTGGPYGCTCSYCAENYPDYNCAGDHVGTFHLTDSTIQNSDFTIKYSISEDGILSTDSEGIMTQKRTKDESPTPYVDEGCISSITHVECNTACGYFTRDCLDKNGWISQTGIKTAFGGIQYYSEVSGNAPSFTSTPAASNEISRTETQIVYYSITRPAGYPTSSAYSSSDWIDSVYSTKTLSDPKDLTYFKNITKEVYNLQNTSIKYQKVLNNNSTIMLDSNAGGIQNGDFAIGINKYDLIKNKVTEIIGTGYVYTSSDNSTPCGASSFNGTIIKAIPFKITLSSVNQDINSDLNNGDILSAKLFSFDNINENLNISAGTSFKVCYKLTNVIGF